MLTPQRAARGLMLAASCLFVGCTFIGVDDPATLRQMQSAKAFGPPVNVRYEVLLDKGITRDRADRLLSAWNENYAGDFGLRATPVIYREFDRGHDASSYGQIEAQLLTVPLEPGVDRVIWFVGHTPEEYVVGGFMSLLSAPLPLGGDALFTVYGYTNDSTQTHSFVFAYPDASGSLLLPPSRVTAHEMFHQMGCGHFSMDECYRRIAFLKNVGNDHPGDMFPAILYPDRRTKGEPYQAATFRIQVNSALQDELAMGQR
jgi:hypothetical protein